MSSVRYFACILAVNAWSKAAGEAVFAGGGNPPTCGHRVSWFRYCTLLVVGVGAVCCTKCKGGGAVLVRESSVGCGSAVGCGNSPALTKCQLTAASVALVIVSIKSCVWRGEILSLTGSVSRSARGARAGVVRGRESSARRSMRLRAIRDGNGGSVPSSSSGA